MPTESLSPDALDAELQLIQKTLERTHEPVLALHDPVLPASAEKVGGLTKDPAHDHPLIATPASVQEHLLDARRHEPVVETLSYADEADEAN